MTQSLKVFTFSLLNFLSLILTETLEIPLHCHQKKKIPLTVMPEL